MALPKIKEKYGSYIVEPQTPMLSKMLLKSSEACSKSQFWSNLHKLSRYPSLAMIEKIQSHTMVNTQSRILSNSFWKALIKLLMPGLK